jgi:hypothetical protein
MPHPEFLLKLPGQACRALCRKTHHGNSCSRAASQIPLAGPALDLFDSARPARARRARPSRFAGLSQTAYAAILKTFQALFERTEEIGDT